jgi:hypothetical protein
MFFRSKPVGSYR